MLLLRDYSENVTVKHSLIDDNDVRVTYELVHEWLTVCFKGWKRIICKTYNKEAYCHLSLCWKTF
jgi:hypothetical protein